MKRLFSKYFSEDFEDYKIGVTITKLGSVEFNEIKKRYAIKR